MTRLDLMRKLFALPLIVGLVLAPLAAKAMPDRPEAMAHAAMADDMPCCPVNADVPMDCGKCVLMSTCVGTSPTALPEAFVTLQTVFASVRTTVPPGDLLRAGLTHPPPAKPPRILALSA